MASGTIRVGIIGANPDRGWAVRAHIPALRALPDYRITAVGTSRPSSAEAAARLFGVPHAFTDPVELAEHPEVDLVAVTVKVPAHARLVRAALEAGKHVYCEWPLALSTEQADALAASAAGAALHHAVGLQARYAPAVARARELVAGGYLGRVTSATVYAARGKGADPKVPDWAAYTLDRDNAAGLLEVAGGHTLDTLEFLIGDIAGLSAALAVQRPDYVVEQTGERIDASSPDQLLLHGTSRDGAVISAHIHDAKVTDGRTRIDIAGTEGDLAIVSGALGPAGVQISELRLLGSRGRHGSWQQLPIGRHGTEVPAEAGDVAGIEAGNVARLYAALAGDIRTGARTVPDFLRGRQVHRLLDTIRRSARAGGRLAVPAATGAAAATATLDG